MENNTKGVLLALLCTVIVSTAQLLLKLGSGNFSLSLNQVYNYPLLIGGVLYVLGAFVFIWAFRFGELSVVYPIMAFGYVLVSLSSAYYLNESLVYYKWVGVGLIVMGVVFIGKGGKK